MFRASMGLHEKTRTETSPCSGLSHAINALNNHVRYEWTRLKQ